VLIVLWVEGLIFYQKPAVVIGHFEIVLDACNDVDNGVGAKKGGD